MFFFIKYTTKLKKYEMISQSEILIFVVWVMLRF